MIESLPYMGGPHEAEDDFNLTIVRADGAVLLGRKTRGFGAGQLVLPGGKTRYYTGTSGVGLIPFGHEAAREAREETGLPITSAELVHRGVLHIADEEDTKVVRLYETSIAAEIAAASTELADLAWHPEERLPYAAMPQDYKLWLPHILSGYAVTAFFESEAGKLVDAKVFRQRIDPLERAEVVAVDLNESFLLS